jgi:hypothetical protein
MDGEYDIMGNPIGGSAAAAAAAPAAADGEYDIMGNPIAAAGGSGAPPGMEKAQPEPLFKTGDKCEVKEGGSKYRAATVVKFDEGIGAVDVAYSDGEKECGVPVNLVRKPGAGGGAKPTKPQSKPSPVKQQQQQQQGPVDYVEEARPPPRRRNKGSKELARQIYDLVKTFSEEEQQAAFQMLQALDSVRASASSSEQ